VFAGAGGPVFLRLDLFRGSAVDCSSTEMIPANRDAASCLRCGKKNKQSGNDVSLSLVDRRSGASLSNDKCVRVLMK
jgi:hypothetical protein